MRRNTPRQFLAAFLFSSVCYSQDVVFQQPVLQQLHAETTITLPDRGTSQLGSIATNRSMWSQYGPLRNGASFSREVNHSSLSSSVYIHDFQLMDKILLAEGRQRMKSSSARKAFDFQVPLVQPNSPNHGVVTNDSKVDNPETDRTQALSVLKKHRN